MQAILLLAIALSISLSLTDAAPFNVDLTKFAAKSGARFYGIASAQGGRDVAMVGDHNGDGFEDYVVSSPSRNDIVVIVMKRNTTNADLKISDIVSDEFFRVVTGPSSYQTGASLGGVGDINGDSFDDVLIGCGRSSGGFAVVIFGMKGPFTNVAVTTNWASTSVGFRIVGPAGDFYFPQSPRTARGLGDVNGDGVNDFAIGSSFYNTNPDKTGSGVVWVIFGKDDGNYATIDALPTNFGSSGVYFSGEAKDDSFGRCLMPAGDFNGDGIADILVGAPFAYPVVNAITRSVAGVAYLIFGRKGLATMEMSSFVTGAMGVRFLGAAAGDQLGYGLGGVGDINDDGIDDIAIGAPDFDRSGTGNNCGVLYIIYGNKGTYTADIDLLNFAATSKGFVILGQTSNMGLYIASPAGDVNGDGVNDIVVGGNGDDSRVHIVYGEKGERAADVKTATDNVMTFFFTNGARLGGSLDGGKDVNGDGVPDILLGAPRATITPESGGSAITTAGAVWMIPGPFILPTEKPTKNPTQKPTLSPSTFPTPLPSAPTAVPSELPSAVPSVTKTATPTKEPSLIPTVFPTLFPSAVPSAQPTWSPSETPTLDPSALPTQIPSLVPSAGPTNMPTLYPTLDPSAKPTLAPTVVPTVAPTANPSVAPSARPTVPAAANFQLTVDVTQEILSLAKSDYDADKIAYNLTIQHTVADAVNGATPERVTDIVVEEEEEEEGGRTGKKFDVLAGGAVTLKYKITVFDPVLSVESMRADLVQAAQEGTMVASLRVFAVQFGATGLTNATLAAPQVTNAAVQRDSSSQLTGVMIALLAIGVPMCLVILLTLMLFSYHQRQTQLSNAVDGERQLDQVL